MNKNFYIGIAAVILFVSIFSISLPTKVALASGCPDNMNYGSSSPITVFNSMWVSHGINLHGWTSPSGSTLNTDIIDWGSGLNCSPYPSATSTATSTVTVLPTSY